MKFMRQNYKRYRYSTSDQFYSEKRRQTYMIFTFVYHQKRFASPRTKTNLTLNTCTSSEFVKYANSTQNTFTSNCIRNTRTYLSEDIMKDINAFLDDEYLRTDIPPMCMVNRYRKMKEQNNTQKILDIQKPSELIECGREKEKKLEWLMCFSNIMVKYYKNIRCKISFVIFFEKIFDLLPCFNVARPPLCFLSKKQRSINSLVLIDLVYQK